MSGARESYGDQLYGIYEIDEAGNYQNTGITDFITENKILNPDDFEFAHFSKNGLFPIKASNLTTVLLAFPI